MTLAIALTPYRSPDPLTTGSVLFSLLVPLGLALVLLAVGLRSVLSRGSVSGLEKSWLILIRSWGLEDALAQDPMGAAQAGVAWTRIRGPGAIGSALGILVGLFGVCVASLAATGSLLAITGPGAIGLSAIYFFFMALGFFGGTALGFGLLRRDAGGGKTYGDLRPRSLSDYRSPMVRTTALAVLALTLLVTVSVSPDIGWPLRLHLLGGAILTISGQPWVIYVIPAAMALVVVVAEVLMARIASLPRLPVVRDPELARPLDDMIRSDAIGSIQGWSLMSFGWLGAAQCQLLDGNLPFADEKAVWGDLLTFVMIGVWLAGGVAMSSHGHLGGSLSGWPRQIWKTGRT